MGTKTRIQKISLDLGYIIIRHAPVDWEVEIEGKIKKGNVVEINILGVSFGGFRAQVRSGLEGTVIAFDAGRFALTMYSVMPVPEGFHGNAS